MIIYHVIPNLIIGGAQSALKTLINGLPDYQHRIWILENRVDKAWEGYDIEHISVLQLYRRMEKESDNSVVFHFHWFPPFKFKIPKFLENKNRCIVTIQDNLLCTIEGADAYVVSTPTGIHYVPHAAKFSVIPPGINLHLWNNLNTKRTKGLLARHSTIYPNKVSPLMLEDMKNYNPAKFSWEVIGVGDDQYILSLNEICKNHPSIKIASYDHIGLRLNQAWLYVYHAPENYEHFGLCFMEALACGLPIITDDQIGGKAQIRDTYNGFICRDYKEMCERVEFLYENPTVYEELSRNVKSLNFEKKQKEYIQSYERLYLESALQTSFR